MISLVIEWFGVLKTIKIRKRRETMVQLDI